MLKFSVFIIIVSLLWSCDTQKKYCKETFQEQYFYSALSNFSSSPHYLVAKVKNGSTGLVKEICTDSKNLSFVIMDEYPSGFLDSLLIQKRCNLVLELKQAKNLQDIGFFNYNSGILDSLRKTIPKSVFDTIAKLPRIEGIKKVASYSKAIENNYFEHLLIENGIGCRRDDETGITVPEIANEKGNY